MAQAATLGFLFRDDQGIVTRNEWWRGTGILAGPLALLYAGWSVLSPYANRGLDERKLIDPLTIATYVYLIVFAFAVLFIAVCFVTLSIKRLRARGLYTGLAGLMPFTALIAGAAHWLQPRVADSMPYAIVWACDLALLASLVWCIVELGFREAP